MQLYLINPKQNQYSGHVDSLLFSVKSFFTSLQSLSQFFNVLLSSLYNNGPNIEMVTYFCAPRASELASLFLQITPY